MIVCHKYQYIFLKTSKTAGTSVEIALSKFCDEGDIITPISPVDEEIRASLGGYPSRPYPAALSEYSSADWMRRWVKGKHKQRYYNHIPARKLKSRLEPSVWNDYFRFCIVRNPWDRVISQYFWRCRRLPESQWPTLDQFLESGDVRSLMRKGYNLYTSNGKVQADRIMRYESLSKDLESIRLHLGMPELLELPMAKSGHRKDKRHYRDVLNSRQKDRIAKIFRDEILLTGYEF